MHGKTPVRERTRPQVESTSVLLTGDLVEVYELRGPNVGEVSSDILANLCPLLQTIINHNESVRKMQRRNCHSTVGPAVMRSAPGAVAERVSFSRSDGYVDD